MIKAEVIERFDLKDFTKLKNITRKDRSKNKEGSLYVGDTFECDESMCKYLSGDNPIKKQVIKIIEVVPKKEEKKEESEIEKEIENTEVKEISKKSKKKRK